MHFILGTGDGESPGKERIPLQRLTLLKKQKKHIHTSNILYIYIHTSTIIIYT